MKEFALLFRMDITNKSAQPTKEQLKVYMQQWMEWINYISDKGQLAAGGSHFSNEGRVLKPNKEMAENPYICDNVSVAGFIIVKAKNIDAATKLAEKCPKLNGENTSVEIRELEEAG